MLQQLFTLLRNADELFVALRAMRGTNTHEDSWHLKLAGDWLVRAQTVHHDGGYAHSYALHAGWQPSYPETTGYIIPTMLRLSDHLGDARYADSAVNAGNWLLGIQQPDGAFPDIAGQKQVFDTGQIIEGLLELHRRTGQVGFLDAAIRAGDFLTGCQDPGGCWTAFSYNGLPHTYYTRVAANLLHLHAATGDGKYRTAALRNLDWTLSQQGANGYFASMSFEPGSLPLLHTIIYVLEGLLDSYRITGDEKLMTAVRITAGKLVAINNGRDYILQARYNSAWGSPCREHCTTGLAQWAGLLLDIYSLDHVAEHRLLAERTLRFLKTRQLRHADPDISGAISGSIPLWGSYFRFAFNNWTIKFFIDALLRWEQITSERTTGN
ncbi:MAG: beta-L-arabinofuranosidase domain-containing protein [Nitrospirota bacterium]